MVRMPGVEDLGRMRMFTVAEGRQDPDLPLRSSGRTARSLQGCSSGGGVSDTVGRRERIAGSGLGGQRERQSLTVSSWRQGKNEGTGAIVSACKTKQSLVGENG